MGFVDENDSARPLETLDVKEMKGNMYYIM